MLKRPLDSWEVSLRVVLIVLQDCLSTGVLYEDKEMAFKGKEHQANKTELRDIWFVHTKGFLKKLVRI